MQPPCFTATAQVKGLWFQHADCTAAIGRKRMNASNSLPSEGDIARDVLAYLSEDPLAQDTLEGVVEWWLLQQQVLRGTTTVEAVLTKLVSEGLLLERKDQDQRSH